MIREFYSHLELCHYEFIKAQYSSATNAWNVNFNNSNVNNNTRTNGNSVRAFSDCQLFNDEDFLDFYVSMLVAYYECRRKKRSSRSEIEYEMEGVQNTLFLAIDIYTRSYKVSPSYCFIIYIPTIREVFCASFDARICHTWIAMRLERLFGKVLPDCVCSNRKGKGTSGAVKLASEYVNGCRGWIWKFDIRGFFMSIDIRILWRMLESILDSYTGRDKDILKWLTYICVMNRPQQNCVRICNEKEWERLPRQKSLFGQDEWHGLPIGDLLSQMCAGLYITPFIHYLQSLGLTMVANYVDDSVVVHESKDFILECIPKARRFLEEELGLTLHPYKCYIQHTSKGLTFLGAIIKPHRMYCGERTVRNAFEKPLPGSLTAARSTVNSYLGYFRQFRTYGIRKHYAERCFRKYGRRIHFGKRFAKLIIPKKKIRRKHTPRSLQVYYLKDM